MAVRNASELRHRITLERPAPPSFDAEGIMDLGETAFPPHAWEPVRTVWAMARDVSGREFFEAHGTQALNILTFEMRAHPGMTPDNSWSIVYRGVRYLIEHINHRDYRGQWWEIKARDTRPENAPKVVGI